MTDLNMKPKPKQPEQLHPAVIIGAAVVIGLWMVWAFLIGSLL